MRCSHDVWCKRRREVGVLRPLLARQQESWMTNTAVQRRPWPAQEDVACTPSARGMIASRARAPFSCVIRNSDYCYYIIPTLLSSAAIQLLSVALQLLRHKPTTSPAFAEPNMVALLQLESQATHQPQPPPSSTHSPQQSRSRLRPCGPGTPPSPPSCRRWWPSV